MKTTCHLAVKSYSWSENQISTKVEANYDIGLLI